MVSEAAASCALSSTTSHLQEVGLVYPQSGKTLMSGSLSDMNLKYEIDGIDSLKAPQLNMRLKLTINLV